MKAWPKVLLGDVLKQDPHYLSEPEPRLYPKLSVKLYGRGVVLDTPADGGSVKIRKHQLARPGQVILSEIWAKKGAIGIVPPEGEGALCTSHFFLFDIDESKALPGYIAWLLRGNYFEPQLNAEARGTTGYAAIRPKQFLAAEVPLPPLSEQQTLVARLDALAEKTRQVEAHLEAAERDAEQTVLALHQQLANGREVALSEVLELHEEPAPVVLGESYPQVGVRSFGAGLFSKAPVAAHETTYRIFNRLYADAIVLSQVKGWEGAIARTPTELVGMYVSPEYRTFRCRQGQAVPGYISEICKTPWFWSLLQDATRGVGARRERTRPEQFLNVRLPMPTVEGQHQAAEVFARLTALKAKQTAIRAANAALLPGTLERVFAQESQGDDRGR